MNSSECTTKPRHERKKLGKIEIFKRKYPFRELRRWFLRPIENWLFSFMGFLIKSPEPPVPILGQRRPLPHTLYSIASMAFAPQ